MTAPVDVLAVMDRARDVLAETYAKYQTKIGPFASQSQKSNGELREARAAVAELIAADKEYDIAKAAFDAMQADRDSYSTAEWNRNSTAYCAAKNRRAAALARVQP